MQVNRVRTMLVSLAVGLVLLAIKFQAWAMTGSVAVLSDALESIINVVAAGFASWSAWFASQPPDENHPYGHGKVEYFSAGFEGGMIFIAGLGVCKLGIEKMLDPQPLESLGLGLALTMAGGAVNALLGGWLLRQGRKCASATLIADGKHVLADAWTTAGVVAGLILVAVGAPPEVDGLVALLVGAHILYAGWEISLDAWNKLMHASDPDLLRQIAETLEKNRRREWIDVHRLRAWRGGDATHIDFHLILPADMPLSMAHAEVKRLETLFEEVFGGAGGRTETLIHLDPCEPPECPVCRDGDCDDRAAAMNGKKAAEPWTAKRIGGDRSRG